MYTLQYRAALPRAAARPRVRRSRLLPYLSPPQQPSHPTCRLHVPSFRALRDDPGFDAIVQALYANVPDYDLQENAYLARAVAQWRGGCEDAEEKEREREAKRRRKEEAAALREKMKAEEATSDARGRGSGLRRAPRNRRAARSRPRGRPPDEDGRTRWSALATTAKAATYRVTP